MRALIAVGTGRYSDPWHPFADNAARVAELLTADGWDVRVDDDVDGAMTRLADVDLLVVAAGDPWGTPTHAGEPTGPVSAPAASVAGLAEAAARGIGVIALHAAVASLRGYPNWAELTGAIWVPGSSMHPPFEDAAAFRLHASELTEGLDEAASGTAGTAGTLVAADERYSHLQFTGAVTVLADHEHDRQWHPAVFTREVGAVRVAADLLGHDPRSYDSPAHRELLRRLARWAARR